MAAMVCAGTASLPHSAYAQDENLQEVQPNNEARLSSLQPRRENGRQIYDANIFSRFNPRTALDMVRQVPGFAIDTGDDNARGLGQADENVLINGARISGKNVDAFTALGRISASNVERLEIVDGATLSISGLSGQVLNVVTSADESDGISGNFKWRPQWQRAGNNWFAGEASVNGKLGKGELSLSVENNAFRNGLDGPEVVTDGFGNLQFERDEIARVQGDRPKFSGAYSRTSAAGSIFNLNAEYGINRFRERVATIRTQADESDIFELFTGSEDEWNAEISADYEFSLGGGRLKLIGLQRFEHSPFKNFFGQTFTDGVTAPNGSQFDRTIDEGESVLRTEYSWKTDGGTDWGINLEGAYNFLDSEGAFSTLSNPGVFTPTAIARVTEYRGEAIGNYGRPLSDNLTFQATFGGEYSIISQSGPNGQTRNFLRPKGSVSFAWKPKDDLDISLNIERSVGQLNFFDFVDNIDVSQNLDTSGNRNLRPPQTWRAELEATQKLRSWGSMTINLYGEKITDIVDSIPIDEFTEARGNLPSATRYGVELNAGILFDPIGWTGARLDIEGEIRKSSVRDPLLGHFRRIGRDRIFSYEISLRHDVPNTNWAWGGGAEDFRFSKFIRLDQISNFRTEAPYTWVFIEHKDVFGLTVTANLGNLLGRNLRFTRTVYVDRRNGPIDFIEDRSRDFGLVYRMTVSGSF